MIVVAVISIYLAGAVADILYMDWRWKHLRSRTDDPIAQRALEIRDSLPRATTFMFAAMWPLFVPTTIAVRMIDFVWSLFPDDGDDECP